MRPTSSAHGWLPAALVSAAALLVGAGAPIRAAAQAASAPAAKAAKTAGSLSGGDSSEPADCAARRKRYLDSQACFEHYRLADGGLKPEAFKRCKEVVDPSPQCGQNLPTK